MALASFRLVKDTTGCEHKSLSQTEVEDDIKYGYCQACGHQVAIELDDNDQGTGTTWLLEPGESATAS